MRIMLRAKYGIYKIIVTVQLDRDQTLPAHARGSKVITRNNNIIGFLACFHAISPERSRFSKIATLFSCPCSTEAVGIAHKPPRSL